MGKFLLSPASIFTEAADSFPKPKEQILHMRDFQSALAISPTVYSRTVYRQHLGIPSRKSYILEANLLRRVAIALTGTAKSGLSHRGEKASHNAIGELSQTFKYMRKTYVLRIHFQTVPKKEIS
jgi:hypothetical protein